MVSAADRAVGRRLANRTGLQVPGTEDQPIPMSSRLAQYARDMKQVEADRKAQLEAEAAEAAKPAPKSLPDQLKEMIGTQGRTWAEVRAELDRRTEERRQRSLVNELKQALGNQQQEGEPPALNSQKLLEIAAGTPEMPHSAREAIANVLRQHWDKQQ